MNIREWISDHLRYVIIGVLAVLIILAVILGIRNRVEKNKAAREKAAQEAMEAELAEQKQPLTLCADSGINQLITNYYTGLGNKDVDAVSKTVNTLSTEERSKIENSGYITGYEDITTYVKEGMDEDTQVAYVTYAYLCDGITTPVPAMSQLYIAKNNEETWIIDQAAMEDEKVQEYMNLQLQQEDVAKLVSTTQEAYMKAQESDEKLEAFLDGLGESSSVVAVEDGKELTVREGCYMRADADQDSETVCSLEAGESVTKTGSKGEWIQVTYNGDSGYVRSDLLK